MAAEPIHLCEICGKEVNSKGMSTVIITDRHRVTRYYHEGCIERECKKHSQETYFD